MFGGCASPVGGVSVSLGAISDCPCELMSEGGVIIVTALVEGPPKWSGRRATANLPAKESLLARGRRLRAGCP